MFESPGWKRSLAIFENLQSWSGNDEKYDNNQLNRPFPVIFREQNKRTKMVSWKIPIYLR